MALDEAVLLGSPSDALVLRFYDWDGPACTFGYSQSYATALEQCRARGWENIAPVRRATGGGIVFHDGDLTFSLVFPWDKLCAAGEIYHKIHRGIRAALKSMDVSTLLWSPEEHSIGLAESCFVRAEPMDLVGGDGGKILGGALRKKAGKGLYQGSLRPEGLGLSRERLVAAVSQGMAREFGGAPRTELEPGWLEAGRKLETRYRGAEWNERR
jgi:lipoate-protein ligase A